MRILEDKEIEEYVSFFKNYYPIQNLKLCVIVANEMEWKSLYNWYEEGSRIMLEWLNEEPSKIETITMKICESHSDNQTTWKDAVGVYAPASNVLNCILLSKNKESHTWLKNLLDGKDFFIMLRKSAIKTQFNFLDFLFHELLHTIEIKLQIRTYRGTSVEQEKRDEREIIFPYVKLFMKKGF